MAEQQQFLNVIDRDEAVRRFRAAWKADVPRTETIEVSSALGRILATDLPASVDVPAFDRSNFDGYAVRSVDTVGASELQPRTLNLRVETLAAGIAPDFSLSFGEAVAVSTGGMMPRGADAVVMVEDAEEQGGTLVIRRAVSPGFGIAFAGTDISMGEIVLRAGVLLTSRETGVLAAVGETHVDVCRRPVVTVISTGNELIRPGEPMRPPAVYDSNSQVLIDAVNEQGGAGVYGGIVNDELEVLRDRVRDALESSDIVLLSGGTSKGHGDLCYRVVAEFTDPGIVVHGVALKPGKPVCLAVTQNKPVVVLPGFPTSAVFTFHEFVAPVIRQLAGRSPASHEDIPANLAVRVNSEIGRTEYLLVGLVESGTPTGLSAFPMGKGSGSVTAFSRADGYLTIPRHSEILDVGEQVRVRLLGKGLELADLVVIGSHCPGLDWLLSRLQNEGHRSRVLFTGSTAGLMAARRGECDVAGVHLLDPETGTYNRPFLDDSLILLSGYGRRQGIVHRPEDDRFTGRTPEEVAALATSDPEVLMVNRNRGSGTRILIDRLLAGSTPSGYAVQPSNHSAVAAAVRQGRADWGVAIEAAAQANGLGFIPLQDEQFDFVIPDSRKNRPAVMSFRKLLDDPDVRAHLESMGFRNVGGVSMITAER